MKIILLSYDEPGMTGETAMWMTHGEFMLSMAMQANQREMANDYEWQIHYLHEAIEKLIAMVETLNAKNQELEQLAEKHRIDSSLYRSSTISRHGTIQQLTAKVSELESQNAALTKRATELHEKMKAYVVMATVNIARADAHQRQVACMVEQHPDSPLADASNSKAPLQEEFERTFVERLKSLGPGPADLERLKLLRLRVPPLKSMDLTTEEIEGLGVSCRVPGSPPPQSAESGPTPSPR